MYATSNTSQCCFLWSSGRISGSDEECYTKSVHTKDVDLSSAMKRIQAKPADNVDVFTKSWAATKRLSVHLVCLLLTEMLMELGIFYCGI
jgi:hypothetical protein